MPNGSLCECGHFESEHDTSGACKAWVRETEMTVYTCGCRGFITPADRREQALGDVQIPEGADWGYPHRV